MVQIQVWLIETRYGDAFINKEMWDTDLDEQVIDFDQRGPLKRNGLRVGRVAGAMPPRLQELMTLERCCVNPRQLLLPAGKPSTILLGPVLPECRYKVDTASGPSEVELAQAQCFLQVTATPTERGTICLRFTPSVEYGDNVSHFHPTKDRSGWMLEVERQGKVHPELTWEVVLAPNSFLVIGGWLNAPDSLGYRAFADSPGGQPLQRLLVLRTAPSTNAGIDAEIAPCPVSGTAPVKAPPLALQATQPAARGYRP
jgi:hypothetical protein